VFDKGNHSVRNQEVLDPAIYPAAGRPGSRGRPRTQTTLTEMNPTQEALYRLFKLDRYRQA
jgi:hypothetical protein